MGTKKRSAEQVRFSVSPEQATAIACLDPVQIWLLCAHRVASDIGFRIEDRVLCNRLDTSEDQAKAVFAILDHYSVGVAVRGISPAGVVGELTATKIKPEYAVLLANAADEIAHGLRILNKSQSYFLAGNLHEMRSQLAKIESAIEKQRQE
ncbi:MAG: hypothetical protein M1133_08710 [Armatimonadetes bacterium]|nr:hypothetical protein [Armatimonadota bacterium]